MFSIDIEQSEWWKCGTLDVDIVRGEVVLLADGGEEVAKFYLDKEEARHVGQALLDAAAVLGDE
jgi:hypothetical protein